MKFAAEGIGMICPALHFVIDVSGANDTPTKIQALCDIVHDELLQKSSINVINVLGKTQTRHTQSIVSISSSQQEFLILGEWVIL